MDNAYSMKSRGVHPEALRREFNDLGRFALSEGNLLEALLAFKESGNREEVAIIGQELLSKGRLYDAMDAAMFLGDRNGVLNGLKKVKSDVNFPVDDCLRDYLGQDSYDLLDRAFNKWHEKKGIESACSFKLAPVANMAYQLADKYDIGVGISRGGLYPAFIFNLLGLPVKIADSHKTGRGASFRWIDEVVEEDLEEKNVLVLDKDVISGRTSKRVLDELMKYDPKSVSVALIHPPIYCEGVRITGTEASNIPRGYKNIHISNCFGYKKLDKVAKKMDRIIKGLKPKITVKKYNRAHSYELIKPMF
ncbi:MAG TPA: phosphoribosyltransferase [Candidatus Nanoarchaeia archaeon]|nr:phosphoribosyltransferase [Candidatus Nanoarchaeia archaeon]